MPSGFARPGWLAASTLVVGCAAAPPPAFAPPTFDLPEGFAVLGAPCERDATTAVPGKIRNGDIHMECSRAKRFWLVSMGGRQAIMGPEDATPEPPYFEAPPYPGPVGPIALPPKRLGVITLARLRSRPPRAPSVNELVIRADGPRLWIRGVHEFLEQFKEAALTIVDRRLLGPAEEKDLRDALGLAPDAPLYDDAALAKALANVPSLPPGKYGELPRR